MKTNFILFTLMALFNITNSYSQIDSMYLGQTPPDETRIIFNLEVSNGFMATERIAISPNGKEIFFEETIDFSSFKIKQYKYSNNTWNGPFN